MKIQLLLLVFLSPLPTLATPSTTYWTPSASCQSFGVPHLSYDSYFGRGPTAGSAGAPNYPTDLGITSGLLPGNVIHAEGGFDLLLPTDDPFLLNGKLCLPESTLFENSPGIGFGIYNWGLKKDVNDYNVLYLMFQKTLPIGGYFAIGGYHGLNQRLMTNSEGNVVQGGFIVGAVSPDIPIGLQGLKKIALAADIQTGRNILGAWGLGSSFYFTDSISLLIGPVFFFEPNLQPGGRDLLWTAQLDVDIFK